MDTKDVRDLRPGDVFMFAAGQVKVIRNFPLNSSCKLLVEWVSDGAQAWVRLPKRRIVKVV